jgi:hypothetical protein
LVYQRILRFRFTRSIPVLSSVSGRTPLILKGMTMTMYLVSYDQHRDRDYTSIWNQLKAWGAKRILESVWFVNVSGSAADVCNQLRRASKNEDSLAVVELTSGSNWATSGAQADGVNWLRQHIRQ